MDYLIDGYNLMFRIQERNTAPLETSRNALIALLNEELKVIKTHVTLVFDSSEQLREFAELASLDALDVVYAPKGLTADQYIIEMLEHSKSPKTLTVVTSDSGLTRQCQHLGAQTLSIDEFIQLIEKRKTKKPSSKLPYQEHPQQIERLRKIFEERLKRDES